MDKITKHVAGTLRAARLAKRLTQEDVAARLDMATESISHIERAVSAPSLKTIAAFAEVVGISVTEVFAGLNSNRRISARRAEQEAELKRLAQDLDDTKLALALELVQAVERSS